MSPTHGLQGALPSPYTPHSDILQVLGLSILVGNSCYGGNQPNTCLGLLGHLARILGLDPGCSLTCAGVLSSLGLSS